MDASEEAGRIKRMLNTKVPLGFFLSVVVLLLSGAVLFGWVVQHTAQGGDKAGILGEMLLDIAASPSSVRTVLTTLKAKASGVHPQLIRSFQPRAQIPFRPVKVLHGPQMTGPRVYFTSDRAEGWRILVGAFALQNKVQNGAIALNSEMEVEHFWPLNEDGISHPNKLEELFKLPHGFEVLPDGSVLTAFDDGVSIRRIGVCGDEVWSVVGSYHHSITVDGTGNSLWTLRHNGLGRKRADNSSIVKLSIEDGTVEKEINFEELMKANPDIDLFGIKQRDLEGGSSWLHDPFHENDVEALPAALAAKYSQFEEDDLLVSLRSLNLIFVLGPESKKIKWWRFGAARRPHDPDWNADGTISLFDNNMHRAYSRIVQVDPDSLKVTPLLDGADYDFYTWQRGQHQRLPNGSVLVTSSLQGRVFEVDREGQKVFEFINYKDEQLSAVLLMADARWLPEDFFERNKLPVCPDSALSWWDYRWNGRAEGGCQTLPPDSGTPRWRYGQCVA